VERLADALDFAYALGLVKYASPGHLSHAPFTLYPAPIDPASHGRMAALTAPSNQLAFRVARDDAFLRDSLEEAAAVDEFTAWLMALSREVPAGSTQSAELLISRNDFFRQQLGAGDASASGKIVLRQVEFNAIAASYPGLSGLTHLLHAALWPERRERLASNDPLTGLCSGLVAGFRHFGIPGACVVMAVQPGETNVFDQRLIELALAREGIPLRRLSFAEIASAGTLREGHLAVHGQVCALAYLRAGYAPDDLASPESRRGRTLLEHSDAIVVPRIAMQLSGTKKVQQVLGDPKTLGRFVDPTTARELLDTFAGIWSTEESIASTGGQPAWRAAMADPSRFVLKPQREGGGNNFYDEDIPRVLGAASARERAGYILMERIRPVAHDTELVREGVARRGTCVSEIGRFGVLLADRDKLLINQDVGYLVRTREQHLKEGGVSAGFGHLDSLELAPSAA
jgi:glutathione synthase